MDNETKEAVQQALVDRIEATKIQLEIANADDELYELQGKNAWKAYHAYQAAGFSPAEALKIVCASMGAAAKSA